MKVKLNGKETDMETGTTIEILIASRKINPATVVVELNRNIIEPEKWGSFIISEKDEIEVLTFMGGGASGRSI
ncbi:MAG: sulfur carrier protein ThiS [Elusimicrobia bacterium]|nr:sulfur carrier protein ThiS [Elusimicrobiota bacterium]